MVSGVEKERKKIEKFFIKQLKDGISLSFYKNRLKQAEELLDKKIITSDKYEEVKKAYFKKKDVASCINDSIDNLVDLINQMLFFKEVDDKNKTYFESFLCYGDETLLSNYISINRDLEKKINNAREKFVEELDKNAKKICFERQKYPIIGFTITGLDDYKKVFKDGYDYLDKFINQIKEADTDRYIIDDSLLCVRDNEKTTKLFQMYSYSLSDEIIYIRSLEKVNNRAGLKKKLTKLNNDYKNLAEYNLRWLYLNKAIYYIKDKYIYNELKERIQDRIIIMKYNLDRMSMEYSKSYKHLNITKRIDKCNKETIEEIRYELYNSICKEIEKYVDANDYKEEDSYYYKYYQKVSKQKRLLEKDLDLIKIPSYVLKNKNSLSIDFLQDKYIDLYVEKGKDECTEKVFNEYIDKLTRKEERKDIKKKTIDNKKHDNVNGYKDSYYEEPLKLFDDIISNFSDYSNVELSEALKLKREFLFDQYENLIIQPDYKLTFYDFLKQNGDLVDNDIIAYERNVEFFASILYRVYSEYNLKKSFVKFCKEKGLDYVPLQYIKPELYVSKSIVDRYKDEDNKELEDMINEALISISEGD